MAIAFVPLSDVEDAVEALGEIITEDVSQILHWFEDTYVGRPTRRGQRQRPRFSAEIWNVHQRILDGGHRTNNRAEAAHRGLQVQLNVQRPSIWSFIDELRKSQTTRDMFYEGLVAGRVPPARLEKYRRQDDAILKLVEEYNSSDKLAFLRGIAHVYMKKN